MEPQNGRSARQMDVIRRLQEISSAPPPTPKVVESSNPPPAGSLIIRDTFTPSAGGLTHGLRVSLAARSTGFQGHYLPSIEDPPQPTGLDPQVISAESELGSRVLTQDQALAQLTKLTEAGASVFLDDQSAYLERMTVAGVRNSSANFSLGQSKASVAVDLYEEALASGPAAEGAAGAALARLTGPERMKNYATAFGLDLDRLRSVEPEIHIPERKKLQEALIGHVSGIFDESPVVARARARWDDAVEGFEANHNSVVIAASNEGDYAERLASENGGLEPGVPPDFEKNLLENRLVTSVGATQVDQSTGTETRASYSSVSGGVDVYANGVLSREAPFEGTSYAAPRVGALMAQLHKDHPQLTSAQVENLIVNRFTDSVVDGGSHIQVVDQQRVFDYLSGAD